MPQREDICQRCNDPDRAARQYAVKNRTGEWFCDDCARNVAAIYKITPAAPAATADAPSEAPEAEEASTRRGRRSASQGVDDDSDSQE